MPHIIFTRIHHSLEEEFGYLSKFGNVEISNGVCWLAAVTREKNYDTEIIDALALRIDNSELAERIAEKNPKYVGISACTMDIYAASDLAERIKRLKSGIVTIIGGPHVTAVPKETMERFPAFDIGVIGEGEDTIVEVLNALENKRDLSCVDGITYRERENISFTRPRAFIKDLDRLPLPAWDLLPDLKENYFAPAWTKHGGQAATILTSRGCPYMCIYCDRKVFGNRIRMHGAGYVMNMLKTLYFKYGIRHFRIGDDNFLLDRKRLFAICDTIIGEGLRITWSCLARVDSIDTESLAKMKDAGCWSIAFGVETGSQRIHDLEKKKVSLEQIEKGVALTRKAGIKTISFNMIGHPEETIDTIKETINFNKRIKVDEFKTQFMTPFPGTELYETADRYGTLDRDWKKMGVFKDPIFVPHGLTKEDLIKWNKKGFMSFYLQPRIIFSYLTQIGSLSEIKMMFAGAFTIMNWKMKEFLGSRKNA